MLLLLFAGGSSGPIIAVSHVASGRGYFVASARRTFVVPPR